MTPIVCVGEGLDVRRAGEQVPYTLAQVDGSLAGFTPQEISSLVVAYEPVWAIGTGEVATPEDAQEVCAAIRGRLRETAGDEAADGCRILYGGSVKAANIAGIMAQARHRRRPGRRRQPAGRRVRRGLPLLRHALASELVSCRGLTDLRAGSGSLGT